MVTVDPYLLNSPSARIFASKSTIARPIAADGAGTTTVRFPCDAVAWLAHSVYYWENNQPELIGLGMRAAWSATAPHDNQ
jgi:hypothetical protein